MPRSGHGPASLSSISSSLLLDPEVGDPTILTRRLEQTDGEVLLDDGQTKDIQVESIELPHGLGHGYIIRALGEGTMTKASN